MNAAVWLGAAIFLTFGADPACFSADMKAALGVAGESYFPGAISHVVMIRYYHITLACGVVALLHLLSEWLYLGRPERRFSFALLSALFVWTLIGSNAVQPALAKFNRRHYAATQPVERQSAFKSFRILKTTEKGFNILMVCGLVFYMWRVANPSDNLRFVRPVQFRG